MWVILGLDLSLRLTHLQTYVPLGDIDSRQYPDVTIYCKVDGNEIDSGVVTGDVLRRGEGWSHKFDEYRISETMIQKLQFSKPASIMSLEMSGRLPLIFPSDFQPAGSH